MMFLSLNDYPTPVLAGLMVRTQSKQAKVSFKCLTRWFFVWTVHIKSRTMWLNLLWDPPTLREQFFWKSLSLLDIKVIDQLRFLWTGVWMHGHVKFIQHFGSDRTPFLLRVQTFGAGMAKSKGLPADLVFQCEFSANCPSRVHYHTLSKAPSV